MNRLAQFAGVVCLLFVSCLAATDAVRAQTLIYDDTVPERYVPLDAVLTFPQFDPTVGILTRVDITSTSQITGSLGYENLIADEINVRIQVTGFHSLALPDSTLLTADTRLVDVDESLSANEEKSVNFAQTLAADTTVSDSALLNSYMGAGQVMLPTKASAIWDASGGNPNIQISLLARTNAAARLKYTYVVPEVTLQKLTNGADADDPDGLDVPKISPGEPVTWTYVVTNTGTIAIPLTSIIVTDSHASVNPQWAPSSDDGDGLLSPNEQWIYRASATAADLLDPTQIAGSSIVPGCDDDRTSITGQRATYENVGTVTIPGFSTTDPSHYCNPAEPGIDIEKLTNDRDADGANDVDTPEIAPGASVVWTYVVRNTGNVSFRLEQVQVSDSDPTVVPDFDASSDDGDGLLSPAETWRYTASATAIDLLDPDETAERTIVAGCSANGTAAFGRRATYENIGSVVVPGDESSDPSHYCNPQRVGIDIEKATNGSDADDPDATDVPLIRPGDTVAWTYVVRNNGNVTLRADQVQVSDSDSSVTPIFDPGSDDGDALLSPGESWTYTAGGNALDLLEPANIEGHTIVQGCSQLGTSPIGRRATYENVGRVQIPGAEDTDPSHYCNAVTPTSIELIRFTATPREDGILIAWEVAAELETSGYNLYRSTGVDRAQAVRINPSLIPAGGANGGAEASLRYEFLDELAVPDVPYSYWLQEVEESRAVNEYGPVNGIVRRSGTAQEVFLPLVRN